MALKGLCADTFRQGDAATSPITTRYYNPEIHRAALALPEFLRDELA
jgi:spermidine synthase